MLEEWQAPPSVTDDTPNSVFGLAVDLADTRGSPDPDEFQVYVAVARVGIEVLKFDPNGSPSS